MGDTDDVGDVARRLEELDFHHPFTPYDVQTQFMRTVYDVLEAGNGQVGILESPTGTGKSLSLICASLTWLRKHKSSRHEAALREAGEAYEGEPSWLVEQLLRRKREELASRWEEREKRLEVMRLRERAREDRARKRRRIEGSDTASGPDLQSVEDEDAKWLLDERGEGEAGPAGDALSGLSKESREVLERMGLGRRKLRAEDDETLEEPVKIYYTSRTHSQLSQFIEELRRPSFPPSLPPSLAKGEQGPEAVKLLPLSSRQRLCINPSISRLGSAQAINDGCAELQQGKGGKKCAYVPREELLGQTHQFRDTALATLPDIEDLHQLGKALAVCPYYASRAALPGAEIVTLPYPLLLQKSAREALGIKLEGNVVIIDEAHNVMDAVANVHAAEVRLSELRKGRSMLGVYVKRFGKKLKGENRVNVGRVGRVIDGLTEWMEGARSKGVEQHGIVDANELTRARGMDQINMYELIRYIQESKLAYKIEGYAAQAEAQAEAAHADGGKRHGGTARSARASSPVLHSLVSFLVALTNPSSEGRIFCQRTGGEVQLSYLLLSPTHAFSSIVSRARAVILAGGTMSPFDDYRKHLFPTLAAAKVTTLSCGHVVPRANLCVRTLAGTRPGSPAFEFSYGRRGDGELMAELGLAVLSVCAMVPDGVVVFFPSYGYLDGVVSAWRAKEGGPAATAPSTWERLKARKAVFCEARGGSSDEVLQQYSDVILEPASTKTSTAKGALLLSVVGGKMSEGINFSDRLGRCVVVVGLPYGNVASAEWKAKMEYVETTTRDALRGGAGGAGSAAAQAKQAARDYYENACMRAVNQSIGRAIRHRGDYAAIVLADRRYETARIRAKLPAWIREGMAGGSGSNNNSNSNSSNSNNMLAGTMGALGAFFRGRASAA